MQQYAKGTFDVKLTPQENRTSEPSFGHLLIEKQFQGDLEGSSCGQMLSAGTAVEGSAGYVAVEKFSGTLHGKRGSFTLQHIGSMGRDRMELRVAVLPDSGTEELAGISGTLKIIIEGKKHFYEFAYSIESPR